MTDTQIIPFDELKGSLPAAIKNLAGHGDEEWGSGQSAGFPVMSIKGKVFRIKRGDTYELVTRPDDPDEAATSLTLAVIRAGKGVARTYYATAYDEDSHEAPDCYSNDGVAPAADAENKQASKCATCPHSQWGSRITEGGKKGKACSEVKRLAVANPSQIDDPMLLRVPPTSLRNWDKYVAMLGKKGVNPSMVVTKVGFDPEAAHQLLTFKPMGWVTEDMAGQIAEQAKEPVVLDIVGIGPNSGAPVDATDEPDDIPASGSDIDEAEAQAAEKAAAEKAAKQEAAEKQAAEKAEKQEAAEKQAAEKQEAEKKAAEPAPAAEPDDDAISAGLDDMLAGISFDD